MSTTQATPRFIVLPPEAGEALLLAAEDLAEVIELRSGVRPGIIESRWRFPKDSIFVGDTPVTVSALRLPRALSSFGSVARRGAENRIFLRARNEEALVHGVYTLAQQEYGARWFLVHRPDTFLVAVDPDQQLPEVGRRMEEPAFVQRHTPAILRLDNGNFYRRNRLNQVYRFNHALANLFNAALFAEQPELFATRRGVLQEPGGSRARDAQPHLAAQGTADFTANAVLDYFKQNPNAVSFSLSINDNVLFDDTELTRAIVEPITWFRGKPNYTDLVFTFMNRVAEKVFDEGGAWYNDRGEPRYLTALAYYWAEAAPTFPIHPRVMPILTSDHAQWHDPNYRAEDRALIQAWTSSGAERIGTWSYYYGAPFPYPRQFNRHLIDSIRFMADSNLRVFYAEMPHIFPFDGPKAYLMAQLLWNPKGDSEHILNEYYKAVFGPAADTMRSFYEAFETMRDEREGAAEWIKFYMDEAGVELYPLNFLQQMESKLTTAESQVAKHPLAKELLKEVRRDFTLTLTYAELQSTRRAIVEAIANQELDSIAALIHAFVDYQSSLAAQLEILKPIDRYHYNLRMLRFPPQSDPTGAAVGALANKMASQPDFKLQKMLPYPWQKTLDGLIENEANTFQQSSIQNPFLIHDAEARESRYLFPEDMPQVPGWLIDLRPAEFLKVSAAKDSPGMGIRIAGSDATSAIAQAWAEGGEHYLLEVDFEAQASPDNRTRLEVIWVDADNRVIQSQNVLQVPVSGWDEKTDPARSYTFNLQIPLVAPENARLLRVRFSTSRQYDDDFLEIRWVERLKVEGETAVPLDGG